MSLWELSDLYSEGQVARAQDVDDPVIGKPDFETELLEDSGVTSRRDVSLVFAVGTRARDLSGWPDGSSCVWLTEFHRDHLKHWITLII